MIDAHGCDPSLLADVTQLRRLFERIVEAAGLHPVAEPMWHKFPGPGGVTGLLLLSESHLACHTFPEYASACINLFCCRPRDDWGFEAQVREMLQASSVTVRRIERSYGPPLPS